MSIVPWLVVATIGKRLSQINVENIEENRRAYRELLFSCGKQLNEHISGVILFHETIYQKASNGQTMVEMLKSNGIIPGIKVDTGTVPLLGTDGECTTQGECGSVMTNHSFTPTTPTTCTKLSVSSRGRWLS